MNQNQKQAMETLQRSCNEENLWRCIVAFQNYQFYTFMGLPFSYQLKTGKNGEYTKEIFINRRANSKSLAWSSIRFAFEAVLCRQDKLFGRPKEIADVRGISYTYSIFWKFGLIEVPIEAVERLNGEHEETLHTLENS